MHLIEFPLVLDLLSKAVLIFSEVIYLLVQFIDILVNEVILLLMLQEGVGDFLKIAGPAFFFDLFETFPDSRH